MKTEKLIDLLHMRSINATLCYLNDICVDAESWFKLDKNGAGMLFLVWADTYLKF